MAKQKLTLSVDEEIIEKAREIGINFSQFLENRLLEFFNLMDDGEDDCESIARPHRDSNPGLRLRRPLGYPSYPIRASKKDR